MRGTFLGVPIIRIGIFWGLYLGSPYLGTILPYSLRTTKKYIAFKVLGFVLGVQTPCNHRIFLILSQHEQL